MTRHDDAKAQLSQTGLGPAGWGGSRVLITGATGFIGSHLARRLVHAGCELVVLVRPGGDLTRIAPLLDSIELVEGDLTRLEPGELAARCGHADVVFHLAAAGVVTPGLDAATIVETNTVGTVRLLQAARMLGCGRFVYCGSCFEYGAGERRREDSSLVPVTEYGASKTAGWLLAEAFSRRHGLPIVGLRPFTVYGPMEADSRLVAHVIRAALGDDEIALTAGRQRRDFVYVADAVEGFISAALTPGVNGQMFNLCTGNAVSVADVVTSLLTLMGSNRTPRFGAREDRAADTPLLTGDPARARRHLGWSAHTPLHTGLAETIRWHEQPRSRQHDGTRMVVQAT